MECMCAKHGRCASLIQVSSTQTLHQWQCTQHIKEFFCTNMLCLAPVIEMTMHESMLPNKPCSEGDFSFKTQAVQTSD